MRERVCLSVCLSCSDFGDYWQVTVDLGINLYSEQGFRTFHCAAFFIFLYFILFYFYLFIFIYLFIFYFRLIVKKMRSFQLRVGTSFCG